MSDILAALKNHIATDGSLSELVGERVQYSTIPEGETFPVICMWCAGDNPVINLAGKSSNHTVSVFRLDIYSLRADTTRAIRAALLDRLNGFFGTMWAKAKGDDPAESVEVYSTIYLDGRSVDYKDKQKIYGWECEFEIAYKE